MNVTDAVESFITYQTAGKPESSAGDRIKAALDGFLRRVGARDADKITEKDVEVYAGQLRAQDLEEKVVERRARVAAQFVRYLALKPFLDFIWGSTGAKTVFFYGRWVSEFLDFMEDRSPMHMTIEDVIGFRAKLMRAKNSSGSIAAKLSALARYVDFIRKHKKFINLTVEDINELRPKVHQRIPDPVEAWEVSDMLDHCRDIEDEIIVWMLYGTGIRADELLTLQNDDWKVVSRYAEDGAEIQAVSLTVYGKGKKERSVWLSAKAKECFDRYLAYRTMILSSTKGHSKRLFPWSYSKLYSRIKAIAGRAGITTRMSPHVMRHTCATVMLEEGVTIDAIAEQFGHKSLSTTRIYAKVKPERSREIVGFLDNALDKAKRRKEGVLSNDQK